MAELPQRPILGVSEDRSGGALVRKARRDLVLSLNKVRKVCQIVVLSLRKNNVQLVMCKFCQICGLAAEPPQRHILGVSDIPALHLSPPHALEQMDKQADISPANYKALMSNILGMCIVL